MCSHLSSLAVRFTHSSSPNGRPLSTLTGRRTSSFASRRIHAFGPIPGRSTGQGEYNGLDRIISMHPRPQAAPAPVLRPPTNPAPTALRSMYRKTVNRWSSLCTGKLLNRP